MLLFKEFFLGFSSRFPAHSKWEVVCYTVKDWENLAESLSGGEYLGELALRRLIMDNFLPNLPKIVEDMVRKVIYYFFKVKSKK